MDKISLKKVIHDAERSSAIVFDLVRHGATIFNATSAASVDRERGWSNVPLTDEGRQEALQAGLKLKGRGITAIVSSDLNRAQETAEIIGDVLNLKPQFSARLRPWKMGALTEKDMSEVTPKLMAYAKNRPDTPVPDGESFNEYRFRAFDGIAAAVAKNPGKIVLVAHHRIERLLAAWKANGYPINHMIDIEAFLQDGDPPGGIVEFKTYRALLDGGIPDKFIHAQVDYSRGANGKFCRTCEYSDHQKPKPHCAYVRDIERAGWCKLWDQA